MYWFAYLLVIILFAIAYKMAFLTYLQTYQVEVSELGEISLSLESGRVIEGVISASSFYNGFCIFLKVKIDSSLLTFESQPKENGYLVIYRDSLSQEHYRLLARLIHTQQT